MNNFFIQVVPITIIVFIICILNFAIIKYYKFKNRNKKSPLSRNLLRSPGQSLQEEITILTEKILENCTYIFLIPVIIHSQILTLYLTLGEKTSKTLIFILALTIVLSITYFSIKNLKLLQKRNKVQLAYECEMAVGQDLQDLYLEGFRIFHDFPAENFNIDHIAIGSTGIYAIETKGRAKPAKAKNKNWKVTFDGKNLIFPNWKEKKPIEQAKRQAIWLQRWIKDSTQEEIKVTPVIALPGWFVERKNNSKIITYNGKNSRFFGKGEKKLEEKQIKNIAFQIERKCRNISSKSYKKQEKYKFFR